MTRDPELRYTAEGQTAVCRFSIAIDRGKDRDGNDRGADFPNIVVFGKTAENCEKYLAKGRKVGIAGHLQTGSYTNKDGAKVYTTDVIADRVEFIDWGEKQQGNNQATDADGFMNIPDQLDDELPFS
jgi:single-strand DNA-binding protein